MSVRRILIVTMSLVTVLALPGFAGEMKDDLLADWRFEYGCMDQSGHELNGQMGGFKTVEEPASGIRCAFNDGAQPKGVFMTVPDNDRFKEVSALTIAFTVKALPSNGNGWILYKTSPDGCDFGVLLDSTPVRIKNKSWDDSLYRIGLKIDTVTKWFVIDRARHSPTGWNHYAITVDLKGDRIPRLYINGSLVGQSDSFGLDDFYPDENGHLIGTVDRYEFNGKVLPCNGRPLFIGGANVIKKNSFQGYIKEVMLFKRALAINELDNVYFSR